MKMNMIGSLVNILNRYLIEYRITILRGMNNSLIIQAEDNILDRDSLKLKDIYSGNFVYKGIEFLSIEEVAKTIKHDIEEIEGLVEIIKHDIKENRMCTKESINCLNKYLMFKYICVGIELNDDIYIMYYISGEMFFDRESLFYSCDSGRFTYRDLEYSTIRSLAKNIESDIEYKIIEKAEKLYDKIQSTTEEPTDWPTWTTGTIWEGAMPGPEMTITSEDEEYPIKFEDDCIDIYKLQLPEEMGDWKQVLEMGAKKHGANNWLEPNGNKSSRKDMCASLFRHIAQLSCGEEIDDESGLHHALHAASRCLMIYARYQRGIKHEDD